MSMRLSCQSDPYDSDGSYGGIVIWRKGPAPSSIQPGYMHVKNTGSGNSLPTSTEGIIHGSVAKSLLGMEPSEFVRRGGCIAGYAIVQGTIKVNSNSCNSISEWSDTFKELSDSEEIAVRVMIGQWVSRGCGVSMKVKDMRLHER